MSDQISISDPVLATFSQLGTKLSNAHIWSEAMAKATHGRFNVFTTVLKATDEVRLHTRFIHCLLDPKGSHDCGALFLNLFFETLNAKECLSPKNKSIKFDLPSEKAVWTVFKEASRSVFGQMDILLESAGQGIAIENKIGASEQDNQVSCYANYLESRFPEKALVIYLTLDGKKSLTAGDKTYLCISYADHVLAWLEKCLQATYQIIPINQVLLQYREVIRQLTNQTLDAENMKPIVEFVRANPDIIRFRSEIALAAEEAIQVTWDEMELQITESCPEGYSIEVSQEVGQGRFGKNTRSALIIRPAEGSQLLGANFDILIEHDDMSGNFGGNELGIGIVLVPGFEANAGFKGEMSKLVPINGETTGRYPFGWVTLLRGLDDKSFPELTRTLNFPELNAQIWDYVKKVEEAYKKTLEISATQ